MTGLIELHRNNGGQMVERNGIDVPLSFGNREANYRGLRHNVILSDYSHYTKIRVSGDEAFDFLDEIVAGDVAGIRDEQTLYTIILNNEGDIDTDIYILNDDDTYLLLCEHLDADTLLSILQQHQQAWEVEIENFTHTHAMLAVEGPYSWELMAEIFGMDIIGIPYLGFIAMEDDTYTFRAGKHGEYGYKIICPNEQAEEYWREIQKRGTRYELSMGGLEVQAISRVENPYFDPTIIGKYSRNPMALQLQWTIRYDKEVFRGRDALLEKKRRPLEKKVVGMLVEDMASDFQLSVGDKIYDDQLDVGEVVSCTFSPMLGRYVAQALLAAEYAYAGLTGLRVINAAGESRVVTTCATPFFMNESMLVNPNDHSFVNPEKPRNLRQQLASAQEAKN